MTETGIPVRLTRHDDIYARLVAAHEGLSDDESRKLDAKLILALANEIGDAEAVIAVIDAIARRADAAPQDGVLA